jgi:hypothetical protein
MTLEEFRRLADTWGANIERWPASCRAQTKQCTATEEGEAILRDAQRLDALLATTPAVTSERISRAVFAVVQQIAAENARDSGPSSWWGPAWLMPATSIVCSALIGVSLAMMVPYRLSDRPTLVLGAILDTGSMGWVTQ